MYAIIETGGKQYPITPGDELEIELLTGKPGASVEFDRIVAISKDDGTLLTGDDLKSAKVLATIEGEGRGEKIVVFKFKRRKHYRRRTGHRQNYTKVKISDIVL
jgi:large subunit ribosomal protein L21